MAHFIPQRPASLIQQPTQPYQIPPIVFNPALGSDKLYPDLAAPTAFPQPLGPNADLRVNMPLFSSGPVGSSPTTSTSMAGSMPASLPSHSNSVSSVSSLPQNPYQPLPHTTYQNNFYSVLNGPTPVPPTPLSSLYYYQQSNPWVPSQFYSPEEPRYMRLARIWFHFLHISSSSCTVPAGPLNLSALVPVFCNPPARITNPVQTEAHKTEPQTKNQQNCP